jgi:hypothetical protein
VAVARPEIAIETETALDPDPALFAAVFVPYPVVVPKSKYQVVSRPFGLTEPLRWAEVVETELGEPVATDGADAALAIPTAKRDAAITAAIAEKRNLVWVGLVM